jgi:hypothetical protein
VLAEPEVGRWSGGLLADLLRLFVRPGAVFGRLPESNRAGGALLVLVVAQLLCAGFLIFTGVPDYEIAVQSQQEIARIDEQLKGDENSEERTRTIDALEKAAVFNKLSVRVRLLLGWPLRLLLGVAVVASSLFLATTFWGAGKADFRLLWGVTVFASCVELPRLLLVAVLVARLQVQRVETSLAVFLANPRAQPLAFLLMRRLDPFELWFWALVGLGLWKTGQMSRGRAVVVTVALALLATLTQLCLDLGAVGEYRTLPPEN